MVTGQGSTVTPAVTSTPTPGPQCVEKWSDWLNKNSPTTQGALGDYEKMTDAEKAQFCPGGNVTKAECHAVDGDIPSYSSGEILTCYPDQGLACNNADNFPMPCSDYKARFFCSCPGKLGLNMKMIEFWWISKTVWIYTRKARIVINPYSLKKRYMKSRGISNALRSNRIVCWWII